MDFLSVCSGIEAASVAWETLGWNPVGFSEIDPFCNVVLSERLPNVKNYGNMLNYKDWEIDKKVDLLVGGTPCFTMGNQILTDKGYVPIEKIVYGDRVVSHKGRLCKVLKTGCKIANNIGICKVEGYNEFKVTFNHPFLTMGNINDTLADLSFTPIGESVGKYATSLDVDYYRVSLQKECKEVCDILANNKKKFSHKTDGYLHHKIESFVLTEGVDLVYNLEIEGDNSYVANGICVHNCQSFSISGLRQGLADDRGNLALIYCLIAATYRPRWIIWENVPGVLSSNGGRDFGTLLGAMAEIGYGFAYRVLDAQYFGVPQRRKRVFVVGHLGDWRPPASVLFESESLQGYTETGRREDGKNSEIAGTLLASACGLNRPGQGNEISLYVPYDAKSKENIYLEDNLEVLGEGENYVISSNIINRSARSGCQGKGFTKNASYTLTASDRHVVISGLNDSYAIEGGGINRAVDSEHQINMQKEIGYTLRRTKNHAVLSKKDLRVRYFTPIECERLQGFPDNWTQVPWKEKSKEECPKTPRYKTLGNSMAVPVMHWLGKRIEKVEEMMKESK